MTPNSSPSPSFADAARGPVMLIAVGLLFAADQMDVIGLSRTWPALLILFGVLKVISHLGGRSHEA